MNPRRLLFADIIFNWYAFFKLKAALYYEIVSPNVETHASVEFK